MKYLVCFDGSENSQTALEYTTQAARKKNHPDTIIIFCAYDKLHNTVSTPIGLDHAYIAPSDEWAENEKKRRHAVAMHNIKSATDFLVDAGFLKEHLKFVVAETSDVRDTVLEVIDTEKVDTVVVGSRGHGAIKRALLGSLSTYLAHHANANVIITRKKLAK
mmetsp:Transcript_4612/g.7446  ORF Transcript_4612/g.7446 Transcript_4612/m.7446 type:complete len:162 (-) Transcript_4612:828-1313(-)